MKGAIEGRARLPGPNPLAIRRLPAPSLFLFADSVLDHVKRIAARV